MLRTFGDGDGGLFTGILARYLALAAQDRRVGLPVRAAAAALVAGTAETVWGGSERRTAPTRVFSPDPLRPATEALPPGATVTLSCQLQAWTILEAAASLSESRWTST